MIMQFKITVLLISLLAFAGTTNATLFNGTEVEYFTGSGSSNSILVVDFGYESYNFGYQWDDVATGWDAIDAISQVAGGLTVDATYDSGIGGWYVLDLAYNSAVPYAGGDGWCYCTSADGVNWSSSWVGVSDRILGDNDWDGFAWGSWVEQADGSWTHRLVGEPVPEPATFAVLGLGALLFRRRRI